MIHYIIELLVMRVFCDLEETLIDNWGDALLVNVDRISNWFELHNITEIEIFSFACWHEKDRQHFNNMMRAMIERAFKVKVTVVWTTEEIQEIVLRHLMTEFTLSEFLSIWGKRRAFAEFCDALYKDDICVLLDDCVPNLTFFDHDKNLVVEYIKVLPNKNLRKLKDINVGVKL